MRKRIESLLHDTRLDWLIVTPGFSNAKYSLTLMLQCLEEYNKLSVGQNEYLERIELHIRNIDPHTETLTINGDSEPVLFITHLPTNR